MVEHNPALKLRLLDGFGSKQSREKFSLSSFSACVMDVVVGKVDLCIGDFWVTESRLSTGVQFLLPFGSDDFYIIAKTGGERIQLSVCLDAPLPQKCARKLVLTFCLHVSVARLRIWDCTSVRIVAGAMEAIFSRPVVLFLRVHFFHVACHAFD